jgi:cytoskeletal protein CcmA (bactofilin family)
LLPKSSKTRCINPAPRSTDRQIVGGATLFRTGRRHCLPPVASSMTTLGPSLTVVGEITCQEDITIHGKVKGQVTMTKGNLVVAPSGSTDANLNGIRITVHGKVKGDIVASERLELTDTAVVSGMISAPSLVVAEGATFDGVIDMNTRKKVDAPAAPKLAVVEPVAKAS